MPRPKVNQAEGRRNPATSTSTALVPGMTFNQTADFIANLLEVTLHTILCLRNVYPASTFTRVKAYGVAVYQNRHPQVRQYIAGCMRALNHELRRGIVERVTFVLIDAQSGAPLERFIFEVGYPILRNLPDERSKDQGVFNAPGEKEMELITQAFLTRLVNLESTLVPFTEEQDITFNVVIATRDGSEPDQRPIIDYSSYEGDKTRKEDRQPLHHPTEGSSPWTPALKSDGHRPRSQSPERGAHGKFDPKGKGRALDLDLDLDGEEHGDGDEDVELDERTRGKQIRIDEPVLAVRSIETGVIDINLMVQETIDKRKILAKQLGDG